MNFLLKQIWICCLVAIPAVAGPFDPATVSADARWFLHLDLESLLKSKPGETLLNRLSEEHLSELQSELKNKHGLDVDFSKLVSLTAYGTGYEEEHGVAVLKAGQDVAKLLRKLAESGKDESGKEVTTTASPGAGVGFFSYDDEVHANAFTDDTVVLGKFKEEIAAATKVLANEAPRLKADAIQAAFPKAEGRIFFLGQADKFNKDVTIPPQAKFLQQAEAIRVLLGEREDQVFVNVALRAGNDETTRQIRQVIDGMIALVRLSPAEEGLGKWLNKISVSDSNRVVSVNVEFPVETILEAIRTQ